MLMETYIPEMSMETFIPDMSKKKQQQSPMSIILLLGTGLPTKNFRRNPFSMFNSAYTNILLF